MTTNIMGQIVVSCGFSQSFKTRSGKGQIFLKQKKKSQKILIPVDKIAAAQALSQ